jgi:hypothetical protein
MKSVMSEYVMCNHCTTEISIKNALDDAICCWPNQMWFIYRCSGCETTNHIAIGDGEVQEGYLDGAPAPCFITKRRVALEKFKASAAADGIRVKALNLSWEIPQRSAKHKI